MEIVLEGLETDKVAEFCHQNDIAEPSTTSGRRSC